MRNLTKAYQEELRRQHDGTPWGRTGAKYIGDDLIKMLENTHRIKSVLDFGCGKGFLGRFVKENLSRDIEYVDYDPGIPGKDVLPTGREFDLVITTDVMEHIEPQCVDEVIRTMERLCTRTMINDIACYKDLSIFKTGPYIGSERHLIIEQPSWWREKFKEILLPTTVEMKYQHKENKTKRIQKIRCLLVHEKS